MQTGRAPKMALFGWPSSLESHRSARYTFPQWVAWLLQKYGIPEMDWFRLAQKPPETGYKYWIRPYLDPNRPDSINPP